MGMMCPDCKDGNTVQLNPFGYVDNMAELGRGLVRVEKTAFFKCPQCEQCFYKVTRSFDCEELK